MLSVVSFYNLASNFSLDSYAPGKWVVLEYSGYLPTAECCLKSSPRICVLLKEFIPSPFFTPKGACMATPGSFCIALDPAGSPRPFSPFYLFLIPPTSPCPLLCPAFYGNCKHASLAAVADAASSSCCTRVPSRDLWFMQKNVPLHPTYLILPRKAFHMLFPYSKYCNW